MNILLIFLVVEVKDARNRLSGALSSAVDRFGAEGELVHGIFGSPTKKHLR